MASAGLRRVFFVQIDFVGGGDDHTYHIVAAGRADEMRSLEFAAVRAHGRVRAAQRMVAAALVAARFGDLILRDGHVSTSVWYGRAPCGIRQFAASYAGRSPMSNASVMRAAENTAILVLCKGILVTGDGGVGEAK